MKAATDAMRSVQPGRAADRSMRVPSRVATIGCILLEATAKVQPLVADWSGHARRVRVDPEADPHRRFAGGRLRGGEPAGAPCAVVDRRGRTGTGAGPQRCAHLAG